jgi:dsDNA-specific endonuclease/ATPase MutS2
MTTNDHSPLDEAPDPDAAVAVPVSDTLDLHAFRPREIPELVASYLEAVAALGLLEVRIIHGKGIGFQRERVRQVLASHPRVERFGDAPAERGHWGATLVRLRDG